MSEAIKYVDIKEPYGFIYITTNIVNGKRYLGQKTFISGWEHYLGSGIVLKKAIEEYGVKNFRRDIICFCYSEQELNQVEYELSVFLNVVNSDDFYNVVYGGGATSGWHPSEATKQKISLKAKERLADKTNHPFFGKEHLVGEKNPMYGVSPKERMDKETYERWYEKHQEYWQSGAKKGINPWDNIPHPNLGKTLSEETKCKISQSTKKRFANKEDHPMYGKKHSQESKNKMSESRKYSKAIQHSIVYCVETCELFWMAKDAGKAYGIDPSGILKCCKKRRYTCGKHPETQKPLHWLYAKEAVDSGYISQKYLEEYDSNYCRGE